MAKESAEGERVVLGFKGGGSLPLKLSASDREKLFSSLEKGGWKAPAGSTSKTRTARFALIARRLFTCAARAKSTASALASASRPGLPRSSKGLVA